MADNKKTNPEIISPTNQDETQQVIRQAKTFWEQNKNWLIYGVGGIAALILIYLGYKNFISQPKEDKANEAIWKAQNYFQKDSIALALNGDGQSMGFEKISKTYSGTNAGNLAGYCAGLCYLKMDTPAKAIPFLKDFSTPSKQLQATAYARLADAYGDLNRQQDAVDTYEKSANTFPEDESLSAESLFRAAQLSEVMNKPDNAIKYYKQIKDKFPKTERGSQANKYLAKLGVLN